MRFQVADTKFKVGDKVRVRTDLTEEHSYFMDSCNFSNTFVDEMSVFAGKLVTIAEARSQYRILEDEGSWGWTDEMFEEPFPVAEVNDLL